MITVGVIGAGPAGIMAALEAARSGTPVLLFDGNRIVGRKLLATGNGRCNLSNANVAPERYTCADSSFLAKMLARLPREQLLAHLRHLGILTYCTADGWYYPVSNSAVTVVDALSAALTLAGVEVRLQTTITDICWDVTKFVLTANETRELREAPKASHTYGISVDRLIVAAGGKAYPALGARGICFPLLAKLGHTIVPLRPALAPVLADVKQFHKLQGVRLDVGLALYLGEAKLGETVGNLMFTQTGFSGPAAMDLSHLLSAHPGAPLRLTLNLIPRHLAELRQLIADKRTLSIPLRTILAAVLPPKVPPVFLGLAGLSVDIALNQVSESKLDQVLRLLTSISVAVKGTGGFEVAQSSSGGVPVTEVDPLSMESRRVKGLYLVGEVLDVVGPCGGYNLHFAFSSGAIAGMAISHELAHSCTQMLRR